MQGNIRTSLLKDGFSLSELSVSPKCTVHSSEGRSTKDLGIDICRVVGSNLCVVNHEFSSGLLLLTETKIVKEMSLTEIK